MNEILQYISFEEAPKKFLVEYRIRSDNLNPNTITSELALSPSRAFYKGEEYIGKSRDPDSKVIYKVLRKRPTGIWVINTKDFSQKSKVEEHIHYLLDILEPQKEKIYSYVNRDDYLVSFHIRWQPLDGHGSYEIESETLLRMAKLCRYVDFAFIC